MPIPGQAPPTPPPESPGAAAPPGGAPTPGQPPIGSSPATAPTQNLGHAAQGIQIVGMLLNGMAMAIAKVGASTPVGQALSKALVDIGKHVPPGSSTPQGEQNAMQAMMQKKMQMAPQMAAMGAQGPRPPMPGAPPGAGAPPPMAG